MAKKTVEREKRRVLKHKSFPVHIDEEIHEAMRAYCYENRLTYTALVRQLLIEKLRAESYLPKEAKG